MKKELMKIEIFESIDDTDILVDFLAVDNDRKFNCAKLAEELNELAAEVLKAGNKQKENQPDNKTIIDEIGDVILRLSIFSVMQFKDMDVLDAQIEERVTEKSNKLLGYIKEGKYNKGV